MLKNLLLYLRKMLLKECPIYEVLLIRYEVNEVQFEYIEQ